MKKLEEIKSILVQHKDELRERYGVREIEIFGSYIRAEQRDTSDLDILIDFERPVSLLHIVALENYLSDLLEVKVDVVPKKNIRKELKEIILSEAIVI